MPSANDSRSRASRLTRRTAGVPSSPACRDVPLGSGGSPPHRSDSRPGVAAPQTISRSSRTRAARGRRGPLISRPVNDAGSRTSPSASRAVLIAPDGRVVWWRDDTGDERGRWVAVPFDGGRPRGAGPRRAPGLGGGDLVRGRHRGVGDRHRGGLPRDRAHPGTAPRTVRTSRNPLGVGRLDPQGTGGLSADGRLIGLRQTENGDILHQALMVFDAADGTVIATLEDPGSDLDPTAWSPRPGDDRLLFTSELGPSERPAIWVSEGRAPGSPRRSSRRRVPGRVVARRLRDRRASRVRGNVRAPPGGPEQR